MSAAAKVHVVHQKCFQSPQSLFAPPVLEPLRLVAMVPTVQQGTRRGAQGGDTVGTFNGVIFIVGANQSCVRVCMCVCVTHNHTCSCSSTFSGSAASLLHSRGLMAARVSNRGVSEGATDGSQFDVWLWASRRRCRYLIADNQQSGASAAAAPRLSKRLSERHS